MTSRLVRMILMLSLPWLAILALVVANAAANSVPTTRLGTDQRSISVNNLKPNSCSAQNVSNLIVGSGIFTGTSGNDLLLGSDGDDEIYGGGGNDCLVGGGGDDILIGGDGNDTCIGGAGSDTYDVSCENQK
ncbi:MAG TPA: hypothetical protein PKA05_00680 [Roseiflexaceae bacterium]|nr:hypothetical protein [Roseiflexaceae bacterium]